jgi:hypothetical protein
MACEKCHGPLFRGVPICICCQRPAKLPGPTSKHPLVRFVDGLHILALLGWLAGAVIVLKVMTMVTACNNEKYRTAPAERGPTSEESAR